MHSWIYLDIVTCPSNLVWRFSFRLGRCYYPYHDF